LPGKDYLTEDNKNWSASAPDTHKQTEKNCRALTLGDDAYKELISGMCTDSHPQKIVAYDVVP
jgi:hypothetical protein